MSVAAARRRRLPPQQPVLEAQDLQRHYRIGRGFFKPAGAS